MRKLTQKTLLFFSLFSMAFANYEYIGPYVQIFALFLIFASCLAGFFFGGVNLFPPSTFDVIILFLSLQSIAASIFYGNTYISQYTLIFLSVYICICFIVRSLSVFEIVKIFSAVYIFSIAVIFLLNHAELFDAFDLSNNRWEVRFYPLGTHPNLAGFIFGAGFLLLLVSAFLFHGWMRLSYIIFSFLSASIVVACQARAGLLAAVCGLIFTGSILFGFLSNKVRTYFLTVCSILVFILIYNFDAVYENSANMLDLESDTRGFDSGGSGRVDLWIKGVKLFLNDILLFLFGGGMRSSSEEFIGFSVESSYITILLEFGIFGGMALLMSIFFVSYGVSLMLKKSNGDGFIIYFLLFNLLIFTLIQSIFNRYLIAIGNQYSLMLLIVISKISLGLSLGYHNKKGISDF